MSKFICEYCSYSTTRKADLTKHQNKTNYCLDIQEKSKNTQPVGDEYINNNVVTYKDLEIGSKCKDEIIKGKDEIIRRLEEQIEELNSQLNKERQNQQHVTLAAISKPTTQVKNTIKNCMIQNLSPLLESDMKDQAKFLTIDHLKAGAEGYAKYALEYSFKDKITCTDVSRKKLAWKDSEGVIVYDNEGSKLAEKFFRVLTERNLRLFREIINDLGERSDAAYKRHDLVEAEAIVNLTNKICTYRTEAVRTGKGDDTELKNEFVKYLCIAQKS